MSIRLKVIALLLLLSSCHTRVRTVAEYNKWLNDTDNGCISNKNIAGATLTVKYLPPEYSVLKDRERYGLSDSQCDSVVSAYDKTICFLLTLGPDKTQKEDSRQTSVMYAGIENFSEYADRVFETNFGMDSHLKLYADGYEYEPVYSLVENLYELSDTRNFLIVFASKDKKLYDAREYTFVYDDPYFHMGKVQSIFSGLNLRASRKAQL